LLSLNGTAPVSVKTIEVNGFPTRQLGRRSTTGLSKSPHERANSLTIIGYDLRGNPVAGASDTITVTYTGAVELPQNYLVINEIMYNPVVPDAGFVEIYNKSLTFHLTSRITA